MEQALNTAGQPVKRGTMAHDHDVAMLLAESAVQRRDGAAIRSHAARLEELALRDGHRLYLAIAQRAWGVAHRLAGELAEAGERLNQALEQFAEMEARWQVGRTFYELGELAVARSDLAGARDCFSKALSAFEAAGAGPDAEQARQSMAEQGWLPSAPVDPSKN
jgi:tetratricopeptide (TPR) repeat protein